MLAGPSEMADRGGELVITMPAVMAKNAANERKSMKKMSVIASQRVNKQLVQQVEVKRIKQAGFFGERSMLGKYN